MVCNIEKLGIGVGTRLCDHSYLITFCIITDINECESHPCHSSATCENTAGSFTCQCYAGYEGDGFTCQGILIL